MSAAVCPPGQARALDGPERGRCAPATFASFAPGPPLAALPSCMREAVRRSAAGAQTWADDMLMGRLGQPVDAARARCGGEAIVPYCQQAAFKDTVYCACVNAPAAGAVCGFAPCANSQLAYRTTRQRGVEDDARARCPTQVTCRNTITVGGVHNVVRARQAGSCGNPPAQAATAAGRHPYAATFVAFLVVVLAAVLLAPSRGSSEAPFGRRAPPTTTSSPKDGEPARP